MADLFGNEIIRTLGLYQPYAGLMLPPYNKIETRWIADNHKPPFPLGKYLIYATQKMYSIDEFKSIAGDTAVHIYRDFSTKEKFHLRGMAIGVGDLVEVRKMEKEDAEKAFVQIKSDDALRYIGPDKGDKSYTRYCLVFENMREIIPFQFKGKQGVGILPMEMKSKIKILNP